MIRALTRNLLWKLAALAASITLWIVFAGETEVSTSVPVIVEYRNIPGEFEISSEHIERLFMRLRGPSSRLRGPELAQTTLELDLSDVEEPGEKTFSIAQSNLGLPAGVKMVRVVPSQIRLTFERRRSKKVPVEVRFSGPPAAGYRIVAQTVTPETVNVVGPESRVTPVESLPTDAIDLSNTVGTSEFRVPVTVTDPQVRLEPLIEHAVVRVTLEKIR